MICRPLSDVATHVTPRVSEAAGPVRIPAEKLANICICPEMVYGARDLFVDDEGAPLCVEPHRLHRPLLLVLLRTEVRWSCAIVNTIIKRVCFVD